MISPKWAVLVAAFALVGAITVPTTALAQDDESQNAEVDIERNNEIEQSIEQSQEACTNEAEVSVSDEDEVDIGDSENEAEVEQVNVCDITQTQSASNTAAILDDSTNNFDIGIELLDLPAQVPNPPNCVNGVPVFIPFTGWVCLGGSE